jgi:hypothetical protein
LTASARAGVGNLRSGQKKACGAVEQKKGPSKKVSQQERKCLRSWRRLENEKMLSAEQKCCPKEEDRMTSN